MRAYIENSDYPVIEEIAPQVWPDPPQGTDGCQFVFETVEAARNFIADTDFQLIALANGHWAVRV